MQFMENNDLRVGMVVTTKNGSMYVVVADDNGHHDVIRLNGNKPGCSNGIEVGNNRLAICGGKAGDNGRVVVKVQEFTGVPTRNRLSEALKFLTGREFTEKLETVWELDDGRNDAYKAYLEAKALYEEARKNYEKYI